MEQNRKAGQNPPRVVAPTEEEEEVVSVYTNVSANYMFRPLLFRPSSGWIP